jgi:UPF0755 protein
LKVFRFLLVSVLLGAIGLGFGYWRITSFYKGFADPVFVDIPRGASTRFIARLMARKGVVRNEWDLLGARMLNDGVTLQAGEYEFSKPASAAEVLSRIGRGDTYFLKLVIPEGFNTYDMAPVIARLGTISDKDFLKAVRDTSLIRDLDPKAPTLEGYLFPDTYHLKRTTTAKQLCLMMTDRFRAEWSALNGHDVHTTVTLASLIEREARVPAERPVIASVFTNRLENGMRLGCDPTTVYAALVAGEYRGKIYRSDLERESPWNTYRVSGLPPGPIASPGLSSLKAALSPTDTNYLYFVAKGDGSGTHNFSQTLSEHQEATEVLRRAEKQALEN